MPHHARSPLVVNLDDYDDPTSAIDALQLGEFVAGAYPASRTVAVPRARPDATFLPDGVVPERSARTGNRRVHLARGPDWLLKATVWNDGSAEVTVIARSDRVADAVAAKVATAGADTRADPDTEPVGLWYANNAQPRRTVRRVAVPRWDEIRRNYTHDVAVAMDRLHAVTPDRMRGRLVLLHGPPGTGKTTMLLTLAAAWQDWCSVEYVLDPERLLGTPGYLMHVALRGNDEDDAESDARGPWRLLVLEDCDELIRSDAKAGTGQALARLLNLTDGVVGKGLRTLVCITTNEDVGRLHPAVTRPGRCLANIAVGLLGRAEAAAWLGTHRGIPSDGLTLAELDALAGGEFAPTRRTSVGMYL